MSESRAPRHEVVIAADANAHAALGAELMARAIQEAVEARGIARVALSGGTTPGAAFRLLGGLALPFRDIAWFWVDERAVPPDHERSNYAAAARDLGLWSKATPREHVCRMEAEDPDREAARARYEAALRRSFGVASAVDFDLMVLGVGEDGHTASLFPGTAAVEVGDRLVAAIPEQPARGLEARLTLTAPVLREARLALVLARGASKRPVVAAARTAGPEDEVPARVLLGSRGRVVWLLDEAAAQDLPTTSR